MAPLDDGVVHLALAHPLDALQARARRVRADNPDQRISQDVGGFINGSGTGINSGNAGIYNYTIQLISSATNLRTESSSTTISIKHP